MIAIRGGWETVMKRILNVVYSCSDYYAKIAGISILSLLQNNINQNIHIYICADNISQQNKDKLILTAKRFQAQIFFIDIRQKLKDLGFLKNTYIQKNGYTTFSKIFISELLPKDLKKILYIDSDTLVVGSIYPIFEINMGNNIISLGYDCIRSEYKKYIQYPSNSPYYNAGVMLIDINNWKKNNTTHKIMNYLNSFPCPLVDQDPINYILKESISLLPLIYNYLSQCILYDWSRLKFVYNLHCYYTKEEFENAPKNIIIYHFCGQTFGRPWFSNSKHPVKALYDSYYYESEWKDEKQATYNWKIEYKIQYILYRWFPKWFAAFIGMLMQRLFIFITYKK